MTLAASVGMADSLQSHATLDRARWLHNNEGGAVTPRNKEIA